MNKFTICSIISIVAVLLFSLPVFAVTADYNPTSGVDTSSSSSYALTATDLTKLTSSDNLRYKSQGIWRTFGYDDAKYIDFTFSPGFPSGALINSATLTFEWQRSSSWVYGARLVVYNSTSNLTFELPLALSGSDTTYTVDISSLIRTGDELNNLRVRFQARDGTCSNGGYTYHDLVKVTVDYGYCGDGVVEGNEECDDGNDINGDGCSATCELEEFCTDIVYDSGSICMDEGLDPITKLSDHVISLSGDAGFTGETGICGEPGFYYINFDYLLNGVLVLQTPSLPITGEYVFSFMYGIGTSNDPYNEDFSVECGGKTYTFPDLIVSPFDWREKSILCDFNAGNNEVTFTSLDTGSIHLESFRIYNCEGYCGDDVVDPPEECELPETSENEYCSQTTSECSGYKLGTRDAYGDCDSVCGCDYDDFSYSCVVGECGADCADDTDCSDKCVDGVYHYDGDCQETCECQYQTENCNQHSNWYNTGNKTWIDSGECQEKEQEKQEYREYYCTLTGCDYSVTDYRWVDTGETRNKDDGTACNDGLWCTDPDTCLTGECSGPARDCVDVIDCTSDSCDEVNDQCVHAPNDVYCDDSNPCTDDVCSIYSDCVYTDNTDSCDDGLWCTIEDECSQGSCAGTTRDCSDSNECTDDFCNETSNQCENPNFEYGYLCGVARDCLADVCQGPFAYFYPDDGHDYCSEGTCIEYQCDLEDYYCTDNDSGDGINYLMCGANCDEDSDCTDYCSDDTSYYDGSCDLTETCSCSYSSEDCNDYDDDYCECIVEDNKYLYDKCEDWICSDGCTQFGYWNKSFEECGKALECKNTTFCTDYICYKSNTLSWGRWTWGTPEEIETMCKDGDDNDCDGYIDCEDPDCTGLEGPGGVICCQHDIDCPQDTCTDTGNEYGGGSCSATDNYCDLATYTCDYSTSSGTDSCSGDDSPSVDYYYCTNSDQDSDDDTCSQDTTTETDSCSKNEVCSATDWYCVGNELVSTSSGGPDGCSDSTIDPYYLCTANDGTVDDTCFADSFDCDIYDYDYFVDNQCYGGNVYEFYEDWTCSAGSCAYSGFEWVDGLVEECSDDCSDTDSGSDYFTQGTVTDDDLCAEEDYCPTADYTDYCTDGTLTEYYCSGNDYAYEDKDCDDYDCEENIICVQEGDDTLKETGDDYSCSNGACGFVGTKTCYGPWYCDQVSECTIQACGIDEYECYYDSGYIWDTAPETEINCSDGHDNDCDGLIDCEDPDCEIYPPVTTKTYGTPFYTDGEKNYTTSETQITLTAVDNTGVCVSGVNVTYYRYYLCGESSEWLVYTGPFTIPEDCCHVIDYYSTDNMGNVEVVKSQMVYVDITPPEIDTSVDDCGVQSGKIVKIFASVTDEKIGVASVTVYIQNPDESNLVTITLYDDGTHGDEVAGDGIYTNEWDTTGYGEGVYYIDVTAADIFGNSAEDENGAFVVIDDTQPNMYYVFSGKDWVGLGTEFYVDSKLWDNSLDYEEICELPRCMVGILDNENKFGYIEGELEYDAGIYKCRGFVTVNDTFHESSAILFVDVWDAADNYNSMGTLIGIDNSKMADISGVDSSIWYKGGDWITGVVATVEGTFGVLKSCSVDISGVTPEHTLVPVGDTCSGDVRIPTDMSDGVKRLTIRATNINDNIVNDSVNLQIDNNPPEKTILSPVNDTYYSEEIPFIVNVVDEHSGVSNASYRIVQDPWLLFGFIPIPLTGFDSGWILMTFNGTAWIDNFDTSALQSGETYYASVVVCDNVGNCVDPVIKFNIDKNPPTWIGNLAVTHSPYDIDGNIGLSWPLAADASGVAYYTVYVYNSTGQLIALYETTQISYTVNALENGFYTFKVTATDMAEPVGNENSGLTGSTTVDRSCSVDGTCTPPAPPSNGGGGGGGGTGGGGITVCKEDWVCTGWSSCVADKQTRKCLDKNDCGTIKNKLLETQSCQAGVTECGDGTCQENENCEVCEDDCGVCMAVCGNGICELDETRSSCCQDCGCPSGLECIDNVCVTTEEKPITKSAVPPTGLVTGLATIAGDPLAMLLFLIGIGVVAYLLWKMKKGREFKPRGKKK